jgi:hypothetical protein
LLRSLDLEGNGLTALPTGPVATLLALESFNVSHNMLTSLPASLGLMPELRVLRASFNLIEDMPAKLGPVTLTELFLRSNRLSGDGTAALALLCAGGAPSLATLDLASNGLTDLPQALALQCSKLALLTAGGNPIMDKKLSKLVENGATKPILDALRKGVSKRALKAQAVAARPPPPRLFLGHGKIASVVEPGLPTAIVLGKSDGKKNGGGGKKAKGGNKGGGSQRGGDGGVGSESSTPRPPLRQVCITREALGVRPFFVMAILHVVAESDVGIGCKEPLFFYPEGFPDGGQQQASLVKAFESHLALAEQGHSFDGGNGGNYGSDADAVVVGAVEARARFDRFIACQSAIHADPSLGNRRKAGALGTHNASEVTTWPLLFDAKPHNEVIMRPLAIGWMESKGVATAEAYARAVVASKSYSSDFRKAAAALLATPLCPALSEDRAADASHSATSVHSADAVLSVAPLTNGYRTRTTVDARGALLFECSGTEDEAVCRAMLLRLIAHAIAMVEGGTTAESISGTGEVGDDEAGWVPVIRDASATARLAARKVRVLVEPVELVCAWDRSRVRAVFPSDGELRSLKPLPPYCTMDAPAEAAAVAGAGKAQPRGGAKRGSKKNGRADINSSDDENSSSSDDDRPGFW